METKQHTLGEPMGQRNQREIKEYLETNENGNTANQILWDAAKEVLKGKFTAVNAYINKLDTSQII